MYNQPALLLLLLQGLVFFDGTRTILPHLVHVLHGFPFRQTMLSLLQVPDQPSRSQCRCASANHCDHALFETGRICSRVEEEWPPGIDCVIPHTGCPSQFWVQQEYDKKITSWKQVQQHALDNHLHISGLPNCKIIKLELARVNLRVRRHG
jgi:hypothetical protein